MKMFKWKTDGERKEEESEQSQERGQKGVVKRGKDAEREREKVR